MLIKYILLSFILVCETSKICQSAKQENEKESTSTSCSQGNVCLGCLANNNMLTYNDFFQADDSQL
jgi:hypothetical protein